MKKIKLYYDDDCPFCKEYSKYVQLRQKYDVELLNARDCIDKILEFKQDGLNINDGFIVEFIDDGMTLQGSDAVVKLNETSEKVNFMDKLLGIIVDSYLFKKIIYPFVKVVRIVLLRLLGKDPNIKF